MPQADVRELCGVSKEAMGISPNNFMSLLRELGLHACSLSDSLLSLLEVGLLNCIESLYRDRLLPTLAEVQQRLRSTGWRAAKMRLIIALAAREPERYNILPPTDGNTLCILLWQEPSWFQGWLDTDAADTYSSAVWAEFWQPFFSELLYLGASIQESIGAQKFSDEVWEALEGFLNNTQPQLKVGLSGAALAIRQYHVPGLDTLSLELQELSRCGELQWKGRRLMCRLAHIIKNCISYRVVAHRGLISYKGNDLQPTTSVPESIGAKQEQRIGSDQRSSLAQLATLVPESTGAKQGQNIGCDQRASLGRGCIIYSQI